MNSSINQQLFKPMSNRTRTRPQEICAKLNTHISQLQGQVLSFNQSSQKISKRMQKYAKHGRSGSNRDVRLKAMTQPKYQELLLNCQLPLADKNSSKASKVKRVVSTKSGKIFRNYELRSSIGDVSAIYANTQSKILQSQLEQSKLAKTTDIKNRSRNQKSAFLHSKSNQAQSSHFTNQNQSIANQQMAQSVVIGNNMKSITIKSPKKTVKTLRQKVYEKQMKLENEWQKTTNFRGRVSSCIGDEDLHRAQRNTFAMTRITNVIDKVKKSRLSTASGLINKEYFVMESSQTL